MAFVSSRKVSVATLALLTCLCVATAAAAEDPARAAAPSEPAPPSAEQREQQAAVLFHDAEERYQAGDVVGAHQLMSSAYELSGRFELLFNLGQLERELGQCPQARRHYEEYLEQAPAGERREQAKRFQIELERECPERPVLAAPPLASALAPATREPVPTQPVPPAEGPAPLRILGWSSLGATLVTGVAATYFALEAARHEDRLEARIRDASSVDGRARGFSRADAELEAEGERAASLARGLTIGAVGLAAVGVSLLLIDDARAPAQNASRFSFGVRAGAARAEYSASF